MDYKHQVKKYLQTIFNMIIKKFALGFTNINDKNLLCILNGHRQNFGWGKGHSAKFT